MDDVAAMIKSIEEMISQISDKVKGNPHIQALNKVLKGPLGYLKKLLLMMVLSLFAATLGPIVDNAKDKVEKVKKLKKIIEKIIKLIKQIVKVVKAIFKAVVKIIKPILQLYFTFPSPSCWVAWAVTIITVIIVFIGILLGRFGSFAGEFVMDFDKMQEMNQVEEDYTDLLNTGALKEAFYESIADTSFYQTFNLSDMEGSNISWADRLVAGVASLVSGQEYTSEDILAQQKCVAGQTSCIYSSGGLMDMFTWAGISVPNLDPRYQITDASKNPAKYLIQAEGLGTYSDALGMTSYFRDYWNREEQFSLDKDFLYELNRWLYETDAYPTTEQIVYPEAFVQPVSFVDDFLRIQSDKTVDGFGDPYVYVTQRVTLEDIQDLDSEYYNKYEYEGLIKTTPSDIVYDYVVKGTNSYEIIQQSASANQVNIGNPSDYATVKKVITYEDGSTEVTYVAMKAYWIVNPIFKDQHMGLDVTFEDYTSYIDPNDDRIGDPTGYYYRETPGGALKSIDITTEAYIGPFLDMSVEGNKIVFNTKINLKKTDAGKITNNDYTKLREYIYQQYNPNIANSAFVTFEDGTYAFVNCVVDYSKSTKLVDKNGNELTKQKLYGKEAIFYDGAYYYYDASASSSMEIDSLSIGSLKKATGLVVFPRVIDYNQYKNTTIYPGEIVVYSSSKKAYQYNGTTTRTLTTSTTNCSRVRSFNTYNLLPTRHYQLAQLADSEGHIVASSRNLINKTYLKTKTVRPYFRNSDEYWLRFEEFTLEDMDRAGYVGVFTDALGIEMQGQCIVKKDEDENFYNLHYCEEADEDKCVAEPEEWDQKKCSVVRYVNQMYPGQDVVAKLSNLFMGDEAEFAELPMSAQSIYTILTLYEDYLIATGTEGVEWEYKYYSNSKMEAAQAAAEMAPSFSFFGIRIPDPYGLASYFESDKRKYEDTFDKVVELNESRAISSEYTPIGVVSGTTPVVKKVNCPSCGRDLGYVSTSTASCWWCGSVPTGIADNKSNVWGWKIDKEVGGTVYIKKVYGESSLEFPDYYDDADTLAQGISSRFDEILNYLGTFDHRMKLASFLFTSDYAENRYGAVNFAYKWVDNGSGGYKLTYDEAALKDFYTCLFLNSTNLPDRVGEDNDTEDNKYQDIRNDEQAWRDDVTVWRPVETAEMEGVMVKGTTDGRGIGRVTTQTDPDDYLALELKSVRDYGLASVLSYLESRKVTFFTGIALTETYQVDGVYAWMYSYYKNNDTFEYLNHDVTDVGTPNLGTSEDEMVTHQAKMASSGFYPSSLLRDDVTTKLIICPHCSEKLENQICVKPNCSQFGTKFNKSYKLNDFVRSTEIVQEGGSIFNQDKTVEGLSVGEVFLPSDLANIADGLNELQGTGESIFKYKNPTDNTWYWFTVTYAVGVNDTNTEWDDDSKIVDNISDLFMESQGYIVMMKKCKDENNDGKISEAESRKTQWIKTNINVAIPYISEYGLQNLYVDKIIERYASPLTQELIKYYSNADARKEVNNQFFNPKGHYLAWYDYSTGNLDLGDMVGSLISQKHLISEYDNNTATQLRRLFNIYESCDDCYCSNANTQITCDCGVDVYVDEIKNGAANDDAHKNESDGLCDICGVELNLLPSGKAQLHHNEKPGADGKGSFSHTVKDLNGDLICDYTDPSGKVCNQSACPCMCHSIYVSFENISDIKTSFWSSNNVLKWFADTFNLGNLFNDAGKYISSTAYQKVYDTYVEQVNAIDLLDDTRTSKVFMIEEAVTFLGNFLYSYDTKMIIAGDVYGDEKIVSDLVFADRGYVISNYIFAVPAHTTYVQWTSQKAETNYITNYPEGNNDGVYNTDSTLTENTIVNTIYANNPCVRQDEKTFWDGVKSVWQSVCDGFDSFVGGTLGVYDPEKAVEAIEDGNGFNTKYCASNYYYSEHMVYDVQQTYIYKYSGPTTYYNLNRCTRGSTGTSDGSNGGTQAGTKYECSIQSSTKYYNQKFEEYKVNEEGKVYLARTETSIVTDPFTYDSSAGGTKAGVRYTYSYRSTTYKYQETRTVYKSETKKYSGTKEGGIATVGQTAGWHNNKYYYKATDPVYNKEASYLAYTWEWKTGATYKVNKITTTQGDIHKKYSKLVYIDTYNEVTQLYMKLKSGVQSVPIDPGNDKTEYTHDSQKTANKIFIGMKVMDNYDNVTIFKSVPENVKDFIEDATHWYTVRNAYKICNAKRSLGNGYSYICNTVNDIDNEECKRCGSKSNFTSTNGAFKLCPICGDINKKIGINDAKAKHCVNCGVNIKKIQITYTQNQSQLNYNESMYDEWCFGKEQKNKCRSLAWGDSENHYTVYSSELLTTHSQYLSETLANSLRVAGGLFSDDLDIEDNLEHRTGLLLGNNRLTNSGNLATSTWWLKSGSSYKTTTSDGYSHKQYDLIVDSNGNLDDDAITYAMTTNDWATIKDEMFELTANDLANIMQAITEVYGKDYDAEGFVELGGEAFDTTDGRAVVLGKTEKHKHINIKNKSNYYGANKEHDRYWNTKERGVRVIGGGTAEIILGNNIDSDDLLKGETKSGSCSVNFYWMPYEYNHNGSTNGAYATNKSSAESYMYGTTVYKRHYLTTDWKALLVGVEAGDKATYGTPIALETTLYGNYKQITPVQTSMFFNEEVYKNWRERMNPDSGDVNSVIKEQYLLSYRNATSTYLYDYLTNFETYLPLSVKSDADLVNRGADAYRSIQANDQRALAFTGSFIGNIKKNLGTTGWVTIIENYNQKSPSLSSIVSSLIPATVSNNLDADILAEYIAGLIETTVEYAPEWTVEYYNHQISEENKAIAASNEGKAEADKTPLKPLIERSFDNYAAIEDTLYYSLFATATKMDPNNMKEYRTVTLYHEDGTKDDYNMLYLGAGAILAREFKSISTTQVANDINGFGSQSLTIGTQSGKDVDERLDMKKSLSYVTIKFGKLLYKYGNVSSATMAYFYGEDYWDEMLMVAKTNGISTGPEWHNDDAELIEEVIARKLGNANADHSLFAVLDYDEEVIENVYTAQVVDYALSFVQDSQDRLFLIRNTSTSLGKAVQSIGSNAEKTKQFLELLQEGDLDIFIGHKYSEDALFTIDYFDIQELARKFNVDLGVVMAVMMGESDGDPCYGLGTCRIQDDDYIITQLIGSNVTERRVGLFGIPYNAQNNKYSTDYTVSKVDYKQACLATPYNNLNQNNDNAVYAPDALASNKSFAYGITSSYKTITNISMNANGEFVVKYDDFSSANLGKVEVKPGFYKGYDSTKQGWVDTDGNLLYTLTDSKLDQNGNLVLTYTYSNPDSDGIYAVVEENLGSVHLISQANNKCTVKTHTSFSTLPTTEAIKSYIYDPYLTVLNVENIAQKAEVKPDSYYADQYETIINDATNFVNNDGRFAYEGRIALFYVLSELAEIYEEQDEDALATIFVYYYGEAKFNEIKAAAISKGYGNNWYAYYCTTVDDAYNKVMKALSYYDATLEEENTFDIKDTLSEYVNGNKSEKTETSKYYDKAYGRYVTESKKYIRCESTATGKCTKTYNMVGSFTTTNAAGGKCDTATATAKLAGRDNLVINSVTQVSKTSTYDRSYSFTYKEISLSTCQSAYDSYVNKIAASGATSNTLKSKDEVCNASGLKNKNTYSVTIDFSDMYEKEWVWDFFPVGHYEDNESELKEMCIMEADPGLHNMTVGELFGDMSDEAILDGMMKYVQRQAEAESKYWNSAEKKCTVSYTVTQDRDSIGLSGIWFYTYSENNQINAEEIDTIGKAAWLAKYKDYPLLRQTGNKWFNSDKLSVSAPSTETILPSVTFSFTTQNETSSSLITAYSTGLSSQSRTTTNENATYNCSVNYTYTQTSDVSDKESCKVGEANVIDAVFTFDDPNYSQGKYRCDVERTRTIDYANNWNLTINGFSVMAFSLFDDMSSYNEVTADKLAKQNSGIEVYVKEGGNTRTDVDSIITATLATEDNFIITADSYSLFAFFEQFDDYLDDSARSWFSPIGLDEDDVGPGTTNKYVKSKIWDFPVLMKWTNTPVGSNNITIVEQFGEENNILGGGVKHNDGITIKAKRGTVIRPVFDGNITAAGYNNIYGNYVEVQSNSLSAINPMIISTTEGERYQITGIKAIYGYLAGEERGGKVWNTQYSTPSVTTSTELGYAGLTGQTTGEQLYFALYVQCNILDENDEVVETIGWTAVDPEPYFTTFFNVDYQ